MAKKEWRHWSNAVVISPGPMRHTSWKSLGETRTKCSGQKYTRGLVESASRAEKNKQFGVSLCQPAVCRYNGPETPGQWRHALFTYACIGMCSALMCVGFMDRTSWDLPRAMRSIDYNWKCLVIIIIILNEICACVYMYAEFLSNVSDWGKCACLKGLYKKKGWLELFLEGLLEGRFSFNSGFRVVQLESWMAWRAIFCDNTDQKGCTQAQTHTHTRTHARRCMLSTSLDLGSLKVIICEGMCVSVCACVRVCTHSCICASVCDCVARHGVRCVCVRVRVCVVCVSLYTF